MRLIIKRTALAAADEGLVDLMGADLDHAIDALSTHSLRVGLTQDLFANGEDAGPIAQALRWTSTRSEEHTYELQSLMRISYDVFCLKKKITRKIFYNTLIHNLHSSKYSVNDEQTQ